MAKSDFISGSILEFKVTKGLGYGYCKILDFRYLRKLDGVLAQVYDYLVDEPLRDITILDKKEWLFGARRLSDVPNTKGKGAWKFKGVLISEDHLIPDFKYAPLASPFIDDESIIDKWYVVENIKDSKGPCTYEQVKHLEDTIIDTQVGIEIRTAMEYYRINNWNIEKDFDFEDLSNANTYRLMVNVPIYQTIPKKNRGKGLC